MNVVKGNFATEFEKAAQRFNAEGHVENLWEWLKDDLLNIADKSCGWTKDLPRYKVTWYWNDDLDQTIKWKRQLW